MTSTYRAEQGIHISGWECGTEIELKMVVTFKVYPGSKATMIDPPEEPSVAVDQIRFFDGKDEITMPWSICDRFSSADGFKLWLMSEWAEQHMAALDEAADARREELRMGDA